MKNSLFGQEHAAVGSVPTKKFAWVEENFFSNYADTSAEQKNYLGTSIAKKNILIFFSVAIAALAIILGRVFYLQILQGEIYRSIAEDNRIREVPIVAQRGVIYDRNGKQLVENIPNFSLVLIPKDLPKPRADRETLLDTIARIAKIDRSEIDILLNKHGVYDTTTNRWRDNTFIYFSILLKDDLDYDTALKIETQSVDLPGVKIDSGDKRHYLIETSSTSSLMSLAHVLGYMGRVNEKEYARLKPQGYLNTDTIGKTGLEDRYEKELRGQYGNRKIEVDAIGKERSVLEIQQPLPGKNLFLSIDSEAQAQLEKDLQDAMDKVGKKHGSAIALNPNTGEIIALVSLPAFDNNDFSGGISVSDYQKYSQNPDHPLFNRAISGTFPSGSIIKPVMAAAALQEKIITESTTVNSTGGFKVGVTMFKDWKIGGHGITDVEKSLAWSINTFYYYIGGGYGNFAGLGIDQIVHYFKQFNLGQKTGIDLPGEVTGLVPDREWKNKNLGQSWFIGDTYNLSIGQGYLLVTPLQAAVWTAAMANGGQVVVPHLVHAFGASDKNSADTFPLIPPPRATGVSTENIDIVKKGMKACVTYGSCQSLQRLPFSTGAKTGTAQWSNNALSHAWFTAFAPYDHPQIVVTALIEEGGEGGVATVPAVRNFLAWWGKKYLFLNRP